MHPVLIDFGPFSLSTYGVLVASGYLSGILWLKSQVGKIPGLDEDRFWLLVYALFAGAILGGKLLYVLVEWDNFASGRYSLLRDFRWGFVFYGGVLGSALVGWLVHRRLRFDYLAVSDYFGVALPMGHWIGRLGCLAAGCCYGRPTTLPWGVVFPPDSPSGVTPSLRGVPLHPTQLYESGLVLAIWLFLWTSLLPRVQRKELKPGTVFLAYALLYSAARFTVEFFRGDPRGGSYGPFSVSQWISLAVVALVLGVFSRRGLRVSRRRP